MINSYQIRARLRPLYCRVMTAGCAQYTICSPKKASISISDVEKSPFCTTKIRYASKATSKAVLCMRFRRSEQTEDHRQADIKNNSYKTVIFRH